MSDDGPRSGPAWSTGPEHDAWLREALRHAPDASAAPPPSLRDAILAEARAAARTATAPRTAASASLLDRVLAFWSWLARPQVAAGFASVMAATLVGMLWWDRPMDETMVPPPSSPAAMAPKPVQEPSPASVEKRSPPAEADRAAAPPPADMRESARSPAAEHGLRDKAPAPAKTAPPRAAEETAAATAAARKPQPAPATAEERPRPSPQANAKLAAKTEEAKADRKDDRLDKTSPPSITMAPATDAAAPPTSGVLRPAAEAPTPFPARSPRESDAAARQSAPAAAAPATAPAPPPAAAPAPAVPQPAPAQSRAEPFALEKKAESGEKEDAAAKARAASPAPALSAPAPAGALGGAALDSREPSTVGRMAAQNAAESTSRQRLVPAASAARPMAPLLAAMAGEEPRWSRRLASGDSLAVDAALRAWLAQVQAAAPRWQAVADRSARRDAPTSSSSAPPAILRLERDGAAGALVQVEDGGVLFDSLSGSAWFAPLPPEVVARLRATLPPPR